MLPQFGVVVRFLDGQSPGQRGAGGFFAGGSKCFGSNVSTKAAGGKYDIPARLARLMPMRNGRKLGPPCANSPGGRRAA